MKKLLMVVAMATLPAAMVGMNAVAAEDKMHTVEMGDTLWDISRELISDPAERNQAWAQFRGVSNSNLLFPGDVVSVTYESGTPVLSVSRSSGVSMQAPTAKVATSSQPAKKITLAEARRNIQRALTSARPDLRITDVVASPVPGIYKTTISSGPAVYSTADGQFFMAGELFQVLPNQIVNLTEQEMNGDRSKMLASMPVEDMIVFSPMGETKSVVSIFTDVDCGYCQKLHKEVPQLNAMGIEVRYMAFPRMGAGSPTYKKIVSAWCSDDKQGAITKLKSRQNIPENLCEGNPVDEQYAKGQQMGISGTPAIVLDNGELIPGYVPADKLAARLGI